jgi:hypothetical protein
MKPRSFLILFIIFLLLFLFLLEPATTTAQTPAA